MTDTDSTRDEVLRTIARFPGIHMRGIVKELGSSTALVQYHLRGLGDDGLIRAMDLGGFVRYFPKAEFTALSADERSMLAVLRQARPLEIVLALLEFGPMQHSQLVEIVGGSKATLTYHLGKLIDAGIVTKVPRGDEKGFHLTDDARTRDLLARYEPVPHLLDDVHDTWEDLFGGHRG